MNQLLGEKNEGKPRLPDRQARILVAPLDWGLGHATRCIPIIRELLTQGCEVILAGERGQEQLLTAEFPGLTFLKLPGYRIRYAKTPAGLLWKMIQQGPKMRRAIQFEHRWLKKTVKEQQLDGVISDNRYGLYHPDIPCIFITHQLTIKSSVKALERILQARNYRFIKNFTECWVPDAPGEENLAGELSHPELKPAVTVRYIGLLSRLEKKDITEKKGHLFIILSGPEPQRTILEELIIKDIGHYNGTATIIRGLPGSPSLIPSTGMINFYNHLPAAALNNQMQEAHYIISRSGYSSVMDIIALQKKSILVPTPGQTEQEYLGKYLMKKGIALCCEQKDFSLEKVLTAATGFKYKIPSIDTGITLAETIRTFLARISKH